MLGACASFALGLPSAAPGALVPDAAPAPGPQLPQIYAVGWQKSGSTVATMAIAASLNCTSNLEAVDECCCSGSYCSPELPVTAQTCVDQKVVQAPLWAGEASSYVRDCASLWGSGSALAVAKADDMLWQVDSLMSFAAATKAPTRFVFYVRHPIFNIRSLLAWCAPKPEDCPGTLQILAEQGGTPISLFHRVFTDPQTGSRAADPVSMAVTWQHGANVYLRDPARFASLVRYEDLVADPAAVTRRVHADVFGHMAPADMPPIDPEAATRLVRTNHNQTYVGQYDHSAGVEKIFAADATESIFQRLKAELYALGYSSQGDALADDGWKVEDVSQRLRIAQSLVAW